MNIDIMRCTLIREDVIEYGHAIISPDEAASLFRQIGLADNADEVLMMACLASDGSVAGIHEISHGSINASLICPREVFKRAILNNAATIVLAHNHPSGCLVPSQDDLDSTQRLVECGDLLGIRLVDHIILSQRGYASFSKQGLI